MHADQHALSRAVVCGAWCSDGLMVCVLCIVPLVALSLNGASAAYAPSFGTNTNVLDCVCAPLSAVTVNVPSFSHPGPPAMASAEYLLPSFTAASSDHTMASCWFSIEMVTVPVVLVVPLIKIISLYAYDEESVFIESAVPLGVLVTSSRMGPPPLPASMTTAAINTTRPMPTATSIILVFFGDGEDDGNCCSICTLDDVWVPVPMDGGAVPFEEGGGDDDAAVAVLGVVPGADCSMCGGMPSSGPVLCRWALTSFLT